MGILALPRLGRGTYIISPMTIATLALLVDVKSAGCLSVCTADAGMDGTRVFHYRDGCASQKSTITTILYILLVLFLDPVLRSCGYRIESVFYFLIVVQREWGRNPCPDPIWNDRLMVKPATRIQSATIFTANNWFSNHVGTRVRS